MTKWVNKELLDRRVILQQAASREHLPEYAVEKDWWVSMTLKALFKTSAKECLVFKGGTSLSKGWHLIDRFSEDIDVALNHRFFVTQLDNNTQLKNLRKKSRKFYHVGYADYDKDYPESIVFLPPERCLKEWEADYGEMLEHFVYGSTLSFEDLLKRISVLQDRFRALGNFALKF